jgi:hypothetical protein
MKILAGFRDFISRGNVVDLAVAVVVGAAFTALVTSLVENLLTPIIAAFIGGRCVLLRGGPDERAEGSPGGSRRSDHARLSGVPVRGSARGEALRVLHLGVRPG